MMLISRILVRNNAAVDAGASFNIKSNTKCTTSGRLALTKSGLYLLKQSSLVAGAGDGSWV